MFPRLHSKHITNSASEGYPSRGKPDLKEQRLRRPGGIAKQPLLSIRLARLTPAMGSESF